VRKELPVLITAVSGLIVIVGQYFQFAQNINLLTTFNTWFQVASSVAFPVGLVSLFIVHGHNVQRKRTRWPLSLVLMLATAVYLVASLITGPAKGTVMDWVYQAYVSPASSTLYGMIAFIITSCCFRCFRFRSREATVLIAIALFVLIGESPLGDLLFNGWNHVTLWIIAVPSSATNRAILLGAYMGGFATAVRVLLGIERAHIGTVGK
jgi:hypothetical protein